MHIIYAPTECTLYVHLLNAPCPYVKNWPEDGSLETKYVASCVLMIIYIEE